MAEQAPNRRPGDVILDRYMPYATPEERDAARENLRAFAVVVFGIAKRVVMEEHERAVRANTDDHVDLEEGL